MKKKELSQMSNDQLILILCKHIQGERTYKYQIEDSKKICEILEKRGVITKDFFDRYIGVYCY